MQQVRLFLFLLLLLPMFLVGQNRRITHIFKQTDTCLALQAMVKTSPVAITESDFLYLMDDYKCIKEEVISLNPLNQTGKSITWLSIPRHLRNNNDGTTDTPTVFAENNFSNGYSTLNLEYDKIDPSSHADNLVHANGDSYNNWSYFPNSGSTMETINSTRGYKLTVNPKGPNKLTIKGALENQNTIITLKGPKGNNWPSNWVGYWLYQEQSPFDAIPQNVLNKLVSIKTQDWFCYRDNPSTKSANATGPWTCALNIGINSPRLKYGDMVILRTDANVPMHWQNNYSMALSEVKSATTYYHYIEKADYTAYMIDVDTTNRPQEIGAFIGDSCIGATTVLPDDTLVLIRGYDKDTVGEVTFENHYSTKSSNDVISDYYVKAPGEYLWQKRTINTHEGKEYYRISFTTQKQVKDERDGEPFLLNIYPNPTKSSLTLQYNLIENSSINVAIYDVIGRKVQENKWVQHKGMHQNMVNTQNLKNGIYLLRLSTGNKTAVKRFVINR